MSYFITGTDTDVGKTIASAWLTLYLNGVYWKPVQSGLDGPIDRRIVQNLTELDNSHFQPSAYEVTEPLSPHEAAKRDGIRIDLKKIQTPKDSRRFIVEGAGGALVPLNETQFMTDLMCHLSLPVILVCRSGLGTINHTLLTLEALRYRHIPLAGLIINGPRAAHNRQALEEYGKVPVIAEIDWLDPLTKEALLSIKPEIDL